MSLFCLFACVRLRLCVLLSVVCVCFFVRIVVVCVFEICRFVCVVLLLNCGLFAFACFV